MSIRQSAVRHLATRQLPTCLAVVLAMSLSVTACSNLSALSGDAKQAITRSTAIKHLDTTSTSYANERSFKIDDVAYPVRETSARLLTNQAGTAPELVADLYKGTGKTVVPGYEIMVINRTTSTAAEARTTNDGRIIDNVMVHRGTKALIGIPVLEGVAQLDKAVLLDLDVIYDDFSKPVAEGQSFKPRGTKLTKNNVSVDDKQVTIRALTLPNYASGERSGGGINFSASATVEGKKVTTSANSTFEIFYTTTPDKARGF